MRRAAGSSAPLPRPCLSQAPSLTTQTPLWSPISLRVRKSRHLQPRPLLLAASSPSASHRKDGVVGCHVECVALLTMAHGRFRTRFSDVLRRLVARFLAQQFAAGFDAAVQPHQYALSTRVGTEALIQTFQQARAHVDRNSHSFHLMMQQPMMSSVGKPCWLASVIHLFCPPCCRLIDFGTIRLHQVCKNMEMS